MSAERITRTRAGRLEDPGKEAARELLRAAAVSAVCPERLNRLSAALNSEPLWEYALAVGRNHRLVPLLSDTINRLPQDRQALVPPEVRRILTAAALNAEASTQRQLRLLAQLLDAFGRERLSILVLKGPTLAALYARPHLRPSDDLDLLVREDEWPDVARLLNELGCKPVSETRMPVGLSSWDRVQMVSHAVGGQLQYVAPCGSCLELHFRVIGHGPQSPTEPAWAARRMQNVGGLEVPTIGREEALLLQVLHMNQHHYTRLIWFADLALMLKGWHSQIDWATIGARCHEGRMGRSLAYAVELLADLGFPVEPPPREARARTGSVHRRVWPKAAILRLEPASFIGWRFVWLFMWQRASWSQALTYAFRVLWPPRRYLGARSRLDYLRGMLSRVTSK